MRRRRYSRRRISDLVLTLLLLLVLGMGVGYSVFSTTLTIDGTSDISSATWEIYFANLQVTSGSVSAPTPSIVNNRTISFSATLAEPGNYYEFYVDIVNNGSLNAKLDSITISPELTGTLANYFDYTVSYVDGVPIQVNDALNANASEKIKVRVEYKQNTLHSLYPTSNVNLSFGLQMTYVHGTGVPVRVTYYYFGSTPFQVGSTIPSGVTQGQLFTDEYSAVSSFGHNILTKQIVHVTTVLESYVGMYNSGVGLYFDGGDATYNSGTGTYNEDSMGFPDRCDTMEHTFGSSYCNLTNSGSHYEFLCQNGAFSAFTSTQGLTWVSDGTFACGIEPSGNSYCSSA